MAGGYSGSGVSGRCFVPPTGIDGGFLGVRSCAPRHKGEIMKSVKYLSVIALSLFISGGSAFALDVDSGGGNNEIVRSMRAARARDREKTKSARDVHMAVTYPATTVVTGEPAATQQQTQPQQQAAPEAEQQPADAEANDN